MIQRLTTSLFPILLLSSLSFADRVWLSDGRSLEGTITEEDAGWVTIETPSGAVTLARQSVIDIERKPTAESILNERLGSIHNDDPAALSELAEWAWQNGLARQSDNLYRQVLLLDHDHLGARRALGYVRVDQQWLLFAPAMEVFRARLKSPEVDPSLDGLLAALTEVASNSAEHLASREGEALLLLRRGQFSQARESLYSLARSQQGASAATRLTAMADILAAHPDGLYVLTEPYPAGAMLLGQSSSIVPPGPASLAEPMVLESALRDSARQCLQAGEKFLQQGRAAEPSNAEAARRAFLLAERELDKADALVAGISRSWRVEIARRRIALLRKGTDEQAAQFDAEMASLGKSTLAGPAYSNKIARMIRSLTSIREDLDAILKLARPYDRDLALEIKWAELDQQRINTMLATLRQELNESR